MDEKELLKQKYNELVKCKDNAEACVIDERLTMGKRIEWLLEFERLSQEIKSILNELEKYTEQEAMSEVNS